MLNVYLEENVELSPGLIEYVDSMVPNNGFNARVMVSGLPDDEMWVEYRTAVESPGDIDKRANQSSKPAERDVESVYPGEEDSEKSEPSL